MRICMMAVDGGEEMDFIKKNADMLIELAATIAMFAMLYTSYDLYTAYEKQVQENQVLMQENQQLLDLLIEARKNHEAE